MSTIQLTFVHRVQLQRSDHLESRRVCRSVSAKCFCDQNENQARSDWILRAHDFGPTCLVRLDSKPFFKLFIQKRFFFHSIQTGQIHGDLISTVLVTLCWPCSKFCPSKAG